MLHSFSPFDDRAEGRPTRGHTGSVAAVSGSSPWRPSHCAEGVTRGPSPPCGVHAQVLILYESAVRLAFDKYHRRCPQGAE